MKACSCWTRATRTSTPSANRFEAEILSFKPWDERRLAYEIMGRKRGLYVLSYFKLDPLRMHEVEHDCRLDERILRALILRKDRPLTQEQIDAPTPATTQRIEPERPAGTAENGNGTPPVEALEVPPEAAAVPDIAEEPQA
jgi:small subunit ribosomal protein S6